MRHEHLVVTVEAGTKSRIDADLEPGESLESWVADAIAAKLAAAADRGADGGQATDRDRGGAHPDDSQLASREPDGGDRADSSDRAVEFEDEGEDGERYYEGFEYVDDCSI